MFQDPYPSIFESLNNFFSSCFEDDLAYRVIFKVLAANHIFLEFVMSSCQGDMREKLKRLIKLVLRDDSAVSGIEINRVILASMVLENASDQHKDNKKLVKAVVQQNGCALEFALYRLKNDKDVVLAVVKQNGLAIAFALYIVSVTSSTV